MHAFRCALSLVSLVFGELFFGGSASLHGFFVALFVKFNIIKQAYKRAIIVYISITAELQ